MLLSLAAFLLPPLCLAEQQWILRPQDNNNNDASSPFNAAFAEKVNATLHRLHVPGISISVVKGQEIYAQGYGLASVSPEIPATADTLYYGGSTTKAFTAAAVSLLVDNGTVEWNSKLSTLIRDDFVLADDYATSRVTVEDALSHRSGFPRHDLVFGTPNVTLKDMVRGLRHLPLTAELRTRFQYSNLMYMTVGYMVEQLTGCWLGDILRQHIWEPLGMSGTYFSREDAVRSSHDFAHGYSWNNKTKTYTDLPWSPTDVDSGAGAIISNVVDYAKWLRMLIHRAEPLSAAGHAALMAPRSILETDTMGVPAGALTGDAVYSLGWMRHVYRDHLVVFHGGSVRGFGAHALYIPDLEWGVTLMANTQVTSNIAAISLAYHLMDEMFGVPEADRFDWFKMYDNSTAETEKFFSKAHKVLYPTVPSPPLPHALHLRDYLGRYTHPIYPTLNISTHERRLDFELRGEMMAARFVLEHVSGEHWLGTVEDLFTGDVVGKKRAEFRIGVAGEVSEFGLELDDELTALGQKTWFKRVEEKKVEEMDEEN